MADTLLLMVCSAMIYGDVFKHRKERWISCEGKQTSVYMNKQQRSALTHLPANKYISHLLRRHAFCSSATVFPLLTELFFS